MDSHAALPGLWSYTVWGGYDGKAGGIGSANQRACSGAGLAQSAITQLSLIRAGLSSCESQHELF